MRLRPCATNARIVPVIDGTGGPAFVVLETRTSSIPVVRSGRACLASSARSSSTGVSVPGGGTIGQVRHGRRAGHCYGAGTRSARTRRLSARRVGSMGLLRSYVSGRWHTPDAEGAPLHDAVTGEE